MKKGEKVICIECNKPTTHKGDVFKVISVDGDLLDLGFKDDEGQIDWQHSKRFRLLDYDNLLLSLAFAADKRSIEKLDMPERVFTTTAKF